jgi:hypothetical protein
LLQPIDWCCSKATVHLTDTVKVIEIQQVLGQLDERLQRIGTSVFVGHLHDGRRDDLVDVIEVVDKACDIGRVLVSILAGPLLSKTFRWWDCAQ